MIVLPYNAKYIDPEYWWGKLKYGMLKMKWWWNARHNNKSD
jgi:hypothetical protein